MNSALDKPAKYPWHRGEHLRRVRLEAELSQKELATRAGLSVGLIVRLEGDASDPQLSMVVRLAEALSVSVTSLLGDDHPHIPVGLVRALYQQARWALASAEDLAHLLGVDPEPTSENGSEPARAE